MAARKVDAAQAQTSASAHPDSHRRFAPRHVSPAEAAATRPLRILVIDDDEASRSALLRAVRLLGHRCDAACDGREAWEAHRARPYDVVLSDWRMPSMDGDELCRRIRAEEHEGYTYFVFVTALDDRRHLLAGLRSGADEYLTKPVDIEELQARLVTAARVTSAQRSLARQNLMLRRRSQTIAIDARRDPLTRASNRLQLRDDMEALRRRAAQHGRRCCVAMCDVDHFKQYNDCFGHLAGDDALRAIVAAIRARLRSTDALYRWGGEEFLVILPDQALADGVATFERVRAHVKELGIPHAPGVTPSVLTISIGVAEVTAAPDADLVDWVERADRALYRAKASGRDRVETAQ
jgi:two-component system, cell cycle response regulator